MTYATAVPTRRGLEDVDRLLGNVMNFLHGLTKPRVQKNVEMRMSSTHGQEKRKCGNKPVSRNGRYFTKRSSVDELEIYRAAPVKPVKPISRLIDLWRVFLHEEVVSYISMLVI